MTPRDLQTKIGSGLLSFPVTPFDADNRFAPEPYAAHIEWLAQHPAIERVYYPGLASHPDHDVARRQMRGFGAMASIELRGGETAARRFVSQLRVFSMATSLGGVESLAQFPAMLTPVLAADAASSLPGGGLVRLSIGCEDLADLRDDLAQALEHAKA